MQGAVCGLCAPSVRLSQTKMFGCSSRSILVQDKGRGSQAPLQPVTPSRKAGRCTGLWAFGSGGLRWSVWINSGVTADQNGGGNPASPLKSGRSKEKGGYLVTGDTKTCTGTRTIVLPDLRFHDLRHPYVKHTTKNIIFEKQKSQFIK